MINGGISLQALMSLLGHVTAEMTLRYASLASPTVRAAYDQAMNQARSRLTLPIAPVGMECSRFFGHGFRRPVD